MTAAAEIEEIGRMVVRAYAETEAGAVVEGQVISEGVQDDRWHRYMYTVLKQNNCNPVSMRGSRKAPEGTSYYTDLLILSTS